MLYQVSHTKQNQYVDVLQLDTLDFMMYQKIHLSNNEEQPIHMPIAIYTKIARDITITIMYKHVMSAYYGCVNALHASRKIALIIITNFTLTACALISPKPPEVAINLPKDWNQNTQMSTPSLSWAPLMTDNTLVELLQQSIKENHTLQQQQLAVDIAHESLIQSNNALYWPTLSAGIDATRSDSGLGPQNIMSVNGNLDYEINLWGQLSDAKKSAAFSYASTRATFEYTKQNTIRNTATAWFNLIAAQQQIILYQQRLLNLQNNLSIVESQYRSGLSTALNVYLARNDLEQEQATLLENQQILADSKRALNLLIGDYPITHGYSTIFSLPKIHSSVANTLPSKLLTQRPDLQAAWLDVLQQNAEVAIAHKTRFPQLRLTANIGRSAREFNNLSSAPTIWSVGGSLLQPILNGGELKAAEKISRLTLKNLEIVYEQQVFESFSVVHSLLEQKSSLLAQQQHTQQAASNAQQAADLALDQYQKGLIDYPTVLESQRRAFDAELRLIVLQQNLAINTVDLLFNFAIEPNLSTL